MRQSEITPGLRGLSKRAKRLGFPQKVFHGCWYLIDNKPVLCTYAKGRLKNFNPEKHTLVLSFDVCLAWLRERGWHIAELRDLKRSGVCVLITNDPDAWDSFTVFDHDSPHISSEGKNYHEAMAKAVVKTWKEK